VPQDHYAARVGDPPQAPSGQWSDGMTHTKAGPPVTIEGLSRGWPGAIVLITRLGDPTPLRRAAVFLFDLPAGGFVWVEPHAWDPFGPSSPASHSRPRATWALISAQHPQKGFFYEDPEETGEKGLVFPLVRYDSPPTADLEAFYDQEVAGGLDLVAERERIRPLVVAGSDT